MSFWFRNEKQTMSIPEFFRGKCVFMTGGSGFIGKMLIEMLLRTCPDIKNIYVLVRPKKGKPMQDRVREFFDVPLFDKVKKEDIKAIDKVLGVAGDIKQPNLGLSETDRQTIVDNVSILYHIAASVRFDDPLKSAILINTRSTRDMITLSKQCRTLDVLVHCSTAYSNCDLDVIEERFYPAKQDWREAIELAENCDEMTLQTLTEKYIHPFPNTYTYTKGLAERVVVDLCENQIPAVVIRPSIVCPSIQDPIPGWIDNFNGPITLSLLAAKGILKVTCAEDDAIRDHTYVDNTVKVLIIAAWKKATLSENSCVEVYNAASDLTCRQIFNRDFGMEIIEDNPLDKYLWNPYIYSVSSMSVYFILTVMLHLLPGLVIDGFTILVGKKPRLLKIYRKIFIGNVSLITFMTKTFKIHSEKYVELEQSLMECDFPIYSFTHTRARLDSPETVEAFRILWAGIRFYLMNTKWQATEAEVKNYARVMVIQKILFTLLQGIILYFITTNLIWPMIA